jgi:hypothetical protein
MMYVINIGPPFYFKMKFHFQFFGSCHRGGGIFSNSASRLDLFLRAQYSKKKPLLIVGTAFGRGPTATPKTNNNKNPLSSLQPNKERRPQLFSGENKKPKPQQQQQQHMNNHHADRGGC